MRLPFLYTLLITFVIAGTYWYQSTAAICPAPIGYKVGTLNPAFDLTEEEAKAHLAVAESVWETAAGRDLFVYDESAKLLVDFVFDERQAAADSESSQRIYLDDKKKENDEVFAIVEKLKKEYDPIKESYQRQFTAYEERLRKYNETVQTYNDREGAPREVFVELEAEKQSLNEEVAELAKRSAEIDTLAKEISELAERGNLLVESYNREVNSYNEQFGFEWEFTQGDYEGNRINVYKFSDTKELVTVLTHEFGHALGIAHVEGSKSVMYYLLENTSDVPVLSDEDTQALVAVCGDGNDLSQRTRLAIRSLLQAF